MTDYMNEAERLIGDLIHAVDFEDQAAETKAHSALLAHIQRGAVPEGYVAVPRFLAENHRNLTDVPRYQRILDDCLAPAAPDHYIQRGVPEGWKLVPVRLPMETEMRPVIARLARAAESGQVIMFDDFWSELLAAAPDHFRDAAEMVAKPVRVETFDVGFLESLGAEVPPAEMVGEPADPDPLHLSRILHELAGAASLCWEPRPTGVFDSQLAMQFVEQALAEIRSRMTPAPAEVPSQHAGARMGTEEGGEAYTAGYFDGEAAGYARGLAEAGRDAERLADAIVRAAAELPDRDSPADWPAAMLVTSDELRSIVLAALRGEVKP